MFVRHETHYVILCCSEYVPIRSDLFYLYFLEILLALPLAGVASSRCQSLTEP